MPIKLAVKPAPTVEIVKTKAKSGTSQEISDLIDQIGGMQAEVDKMKARHKREIERTIKPFADAMKQLVVLLNNVEGKEPLEEFDQHGDQFEITVSKRLQERRLTDVKAAIVKLNKVLKDKPDLGFQLATITLTALDKYLSPIEQQGIVAKSDGDRSVKEIRVRKKAA